jgi:hypothetical protein
MWRTRRHRTVRAYWAPPIGTVDARRRALVAAATMIGAMTMSRMVTDPELSAEILREAEKNLMAARR